MSATDEMRKRAAQVTLVLSIVLLLIGLLANAEWRPLALSLGGMLLVLAGILFASIAIIEGVPWLVRLLSRIADPKWDGEILHTDGDEYKIRYDFGNQGSPRFVASDVCTAIGAPAPAKDALVWSGVPLLREGEYAYFGEADVQAYLALRAVHNHAAKRLLLLIRNNVLHKIEKRRDDAKRFEPEKG